MSKRKKRKFADAGLPRPGKAGDAVSGEARPHGRGWVYGLAAVGIAVVAGVVWGGWWRGGRPETVAEKRGPLSFHQDVAPIVAARCAPCHRPGQAAPFSLLSYKDVAKRAKQIGEVTASRYMPPWLAEPGFGEFANSRRLSDDELATIQRWVAEGAIEGDPAENRVQAHWDESWQLGPPDLVVESSEPYPLAAEGKDVYRNIVLPISSGALRFVKGFEFRPGNPRVVHHASIYIDRSGQARRMAQRESPAGFDGMDLPDGVAMVAGQLLGWEPGKRPELSGEGQTWALEPGSDLVVQLHLHPSGKTEDVRISAGFYFTDRAPAETPILLRLPRWELDIPPGVSNYVAEASYELPVDVRVLRISPHAHYLGKELQGFALLPDGHKEWLLRIKDWDFNWQGDYTYARPVFLPRGSKLALRFTYDNSEANVRNPNHPPRRVRHGPQTSDEMAQLTFQLLANNDSERARLASDYARWMMTETVTYNESLLREDPKRADAHARAGQALLALGRFREANEHLRAAIRLNPDDDKPYYDLGTLFLAFNRTKEAKAAFEVVLKLNPSDYQAHGNLGAIYQREGNLALAEQHLSEALRLNPSDAAAAKVLDEIRRAAGK